MKCSLLIITLLLQSVLQDPSGDWRRAKLEAYRKNVANAQSNRDARQVEAPQNETPKQDPIPEETPEKQSASIPAELTLPSGQPLPSEALKFLYQKAGDTPVLVLVEWHSPKCKHAEFRLRVRLRDGKILSRDSKVDQGVLVTGEGYELAVVSSKDLVLDGQYTMFSHEDGQATFHLLTLDTQQGVSPWKTIHTLSFNRQANSDVRTVFTIPDFRVQ